VEEPGNPLFKIKSFVPLIFMDQYKPNSAAAKT